MPGEGDNGDFGFLKDWERDIANWEKEREPDTDDSGLRVIEERPMNHQPAQYNIINTGKGISREELEERYELDDRGVWVRKDRNQGNPDNQENQGGEETPSE